MCINSIFQRFFPILLAKKKFAPFIIIFTWIVCLCVFHTQDKFYSKKIPTSYFLVMRKKMPIWWPVGQLVAFLVCLSVGQTFVGHFFFFLYIIFIGNLDY
jgi:hypothetical protein